jgi:AcrR family transcriptional regulator
MEYQISIKVNDKIYLRDPESTELGKQIVKSAIDLIGQLGFEAFTFKKLAAETKTTEATIYRYFENKHRLLLYILNWYWSYLEYLVDVKVQGVSDPKNQLKIIIDLLTHELPDTTGKVDYHKTYLNEIVIAESSKVYLVKDVNEINKSQVFKPYKDLCAKIAAIISAYNPSYKYPKSLSSMLIETSHHQQFFESHLPNLTDAQAKHKGEFTAVFLTDFLFKTLQN